MTDPEKCLCGQPDLPWHDCGDFLVAENTALGGEGSEDNSIEESSTDAD